MEQLVRIPFVVLAAGIAMSQISNAQQSPIKRTDLLTKDLADLGDRKMQVWIADISPGAGDWPLFPFYTSICLCGAGRRGRRNGWQASPDVCHWPGVGGTPNAVHNFRNASTTETARALGFQYSGKDQPLQVHTP